MRSGVAVAMYQCALCGRRQRAPTLCGLCGASMPREPALWLTDGRSRPLPETDADQFVAASSSSSNVVPIVKVDRRRLGELVQAMAEEPAPSRASRAVSLGSVPRERVERVACGVGMVDHVLGGGIPVSRVVLLGGARGTGKTTLSLPICAAVARETGRRAFYYSAEGQSAAELAAMLPAELDGGAIDVLEGNELEELEEEVSDRDPAIVAADSMQSIRVSGTSIGTEKHARAVLEGFRRMSKGGKRTVLGLSQMNGEGALRGSQLYQQLCDVIAMLERDELGRVAFRIDGKNRGGPIDRRALFKFDDQGALRPVVSA